jgi:predicted signal transduction protein with EAL and GGDEF domain
MTSTRNKLQLGLIAGAALLITVLGIVAMVAVNQANKRRHETETLLYQLQSNAQGLNANEWEAIASLKIDPDVRESSGVFRREILNKVQIIHTMYDHDGVVDEVQPAASAYLSTMQREFAYISNGQLTEARELDARRVDPDFVNLAQTIHEAISKFENESQRSSRVALFSSIGTLLVCLSSILFLTFRFERGRHLQETNVRLQELVTQLSLSQKRLSHLAYHDSLTQLANRAHFMDQLTQCVNRTKRHQDYKFAVVLIDVDHFKTVNDTVGHSGGDQLIVQIAERLNGSIRRYDIVPQRTEGTGAVRLAGNDILARLGGDIFAILLDDMRDASDGIRVAERIQRNLVAPFSIDGRQLQITVSIGIAVSATNYSVAEDVWRDADTAMYGARAGGDSRYQMCDLTMHAAAVSRLKLESDLRQAESRGELQIHYQPIVSLRNGCLTGFEALIRWQRPGFGLVPPLEFIPVAEETGLIVPIGSWVLREACSQMRDWQLRFPSQPALTIAVNFSAKQFIQPNLVEQVKQVLGETHLDPGSLKIELTESVAMQDAERTTRILTELRALGLGTSIDDFGTGYSSLSYLIRLPLDILKLDRSFVSRMDKNKESRQIVHTIISLADNLGMDVVAEGIETVEQADELKLLGCQYAQGYFFSKPINKGSVEALLKSGMLGTDECGTMTELSTRFRAAQPALTSIS